MRLKQYPPSAERRTTRVAVEAIFDGSAEARLTRDDIDAIREATKAASGWSMLKESGKAAVPSGPPTSAYMEIVNVAKAIGLFLVEEGELEGWHREYGRKNKQAWLRQVFENRSYEQSRASGMLIEIVDFIASRQ